MPKSALEDRSTLTERQQKWFASVREGLERDTGRTLEQWAEIARNCPETKTSGRVKWLKEKYGLGVNRAAAILEAAFPSATSWDDPDALLDALWKDRRLRAIYDRIEAAAKKLDGTVVGPRKTVSTFSRKVQYAAAKPHKGAARLALALDPKTSKRLEPTKKSEGFNERLKSAATLGKPADVDAEIKALLTKAWETA
jgi:hypothetical protein